MEVALFLDALDAKYGARAKRGGAYTASYLKMSNLAMVQVVLSTTLVLIMRVILGGLNGTEKGVRWARYRRQNERAERAQF